MTERMPRAIARRMAARSGGLALRRDAATDTRTVKVPVNGDSARAGVRLACFVDGAKQAQCRSHPAETAHGFNRINATLVAEV
ncbi:hypothetical protein [Agromyces mangrovi Wang et al. 2018]|uniref:hypothetical protein n=1 Tax=Agromyces mangrovi TaxID=1858653 RepID=UPI002572DF45|nr:hypothetical protein [Agromyces mangrovi]BDZ64155.1 hypothetical protein GCM10025877_10930 [Agromyces mangrovi]